MKKENQKIQCLVDSCRFQNQNYCTLKEILVSTLNHEVTDNVETLCRSFEYEKTED